MKSVTDKFFEQAVVAHQKGKHEEAEGLYKKILETHPSNVKILINLASLSTSLGKLDEAEKIYRKAIELKPDFVDAHFNQANLFKKLKRFAEAEKSYGKTIEINPDFAEAHFNLANLFKALNRFADAEKSYRKTIEINPNHGKAYTNLGHLLHELDRVDEAEAYYRKTIELKTVLPESYKNLEIILNEKKLLKLLQNIKLKNEISETNFTKGLISNPFISNRSVEPELLENLYKIETTEISKNLRGPLFGTGSTTNYQLFKNDYSILKTVEKDLINIMKKALKSEIYIFESFYNILGVGGGSIPHHHISTLDTRRRLINQKFSLVYYLAVGDQNCKDPGILKLYEPDEEILPSEGLVAIFPGNRKHSSIYSGTTDRVMIGVNFYSL